MKADISYAKQPNKAQAFQVFNAHQKVNPRPTHLASLSARFSANNIAGELFKSVITIAEIYQNC